MGKRKSKRKPPPKAKAIVPLDTQFDCPFCNHEKVCEVKMDRDKNIGFISCRVCSEDFQTSIHDLSEPIDVYSEWIDACEQVNSRSIDDPLTNEPPKFDESPPQHDNYSHLPLTTNRSTVHQR